MLVKELRRIMKGLNSDTELELKDETTGETYEIYEIKATVRETKSAARVYRLQLITDIQEQTGTYIIEK